MVSTMKQRITAGLVAAGMLLFGCNDSADSPEAVYHSAAFSFGADETLLLTEESHEESFDTPLLDIYRFVDETDENRTLTVYSSQSGASPDYCAYLCNGKAEDIAATAIENTPLPAFYSVSEQNDGSFFLNMYTGCEGYLLDISSKRLSAAEREAYEPWFRSAAETIVHSVSYHGESPSARKITAERLTVEFSENWMLYFSVEGIVQLRFACAENLCEALVNFVVMEWTGDSMSAKERAEYEMSRENEHYVDRTIGEASCFGRNGWLYSYCDTTIGTEHFRRVGSFYFEENGYLYEIRMESCEQSQEVAWKTAEEQISIAIQP